VRIGDAYIEALYGAREAVISILKVFEAYNIAATWATVGFLFGRSAADLASFTPAQLPNYRNTALDPYTEPVGSTEEADGLHLAPSLIQLILETSRQELATHTYSHFYCGEPGVTPEAFREDMKSAQAIAARVGRRTRSIVFPRNQTEPAYLALLPEAGVDVYRGNPAGPLWATDGATSRTPWRRVGRLLDAYAPVDGDDTFSWDEILNPSGLANVRASRFLRPYSSSLAAFEPLRLQRIRRSLKHGARRQRLYHLWWHPHNFGYNIKANLDVLCRILDLFAEQRDREGMVSLSMGDAADLARKAVICNDAPCGGLG
jgi:peptidoglycan/xylan/chitin deacetylase (PgdA/CDA1 family)